jgi:hypothetical protein
MELVSWAPLERYQHTYWSCRLGVYNRQTEGKFLPISMHFVFEKWAP